MRAKKFVYGKTFRLRRGAGALSEGVSGGSVVVPQWVVAASL